MHSIEQQILSRLIFHTGLKYSQLKPRDVEGNHFMYYLNRLTKRELVFKRTPNTYDLTSKGRSYVGKLSLKSWELRAQPKIVTLTVCQNRHQEYLFYRRRRQPFFNMIGFPYGKVHLGENIQESANREFSEKTGLSTKLTHRGEVYLAVYEKGELLVHQLCHIFSTGITAGKLKTKPSIGECFWKKITDVPSDELMPGVQQIHDLLTKNKQQPIWAEYRIDFDYPRHLAQPAITPDVPNRKPTSPTTVQ